MTFSCKGSKINIACLYSLWLRIWSNLTAFQEGGGGGGGGGGGVRIHTLSPPLVLYSGDCVTLAGPGEVCGLNSVTEECNNSVATKCSCNSGYINTDALNCAGN